MNLTITPGAATDDATQIDSIVASIQSSMETLDAAIKNTIPHTKILNIIVDHIPIGNSK